MSMTGWLCRVPDDVLQRLLADPKPMPDFIEEEGFATKRGRISPGPTRED
jgi:hypothetical protein